MFVVCVLMYLDDMTRLKLSETKGLCKPFSIGSDGVTKTKTPLVTFRFFFLYKDKRR